MSGKNRRDVLKKAAFIIPTVMAFSVSELKASSSKNSGSAPHS